MAFPTLNVTPGTGATINTLPPGGQAAPASSLPTTLDTTIETAIGTSGSQALTVQGAAGGVALPVQTPIPATIVTGQIVIAVTGTAVQLPSHALLNGFAIKAKATNAANGFVGSSNVTTTYDGTGAGYPIEPGAAVSFAASNTNAAYVNGTAGDVFSFQGN